MGVSKEKKSLYSKFNGNDDDYHFNDYINIFGRNTKDI
jgi:hypothetical protein